MSSQKTDEEKEKDAKQLKRESLKNFDKFLEGKIETGENDSGPAGFLTNLINKVGQNLRIKLSDIEVVYMFYVKKILVRLIF
jgi:Vacuolar protein sorting-associated protein